MRAAQQRPRYTEHAITVLSASRHPATHSGAKKSNAPCARRAFARAIHATGAIRALR